MTNTRPAETAATIYISRAESCFMKHDLRFRLVLSLLGSFRLGFLVTIIINSVNYDSVAKKWRILAIFGELLYNV